VSKPVTQRPKVPGVGRLGLVEPTAPADLTRLGWNTDPHIELLWSLSRAPDADAALRAMVRLADALGPEWDELNTALRKDKSLRGRLFAVLGSSLALGDHLAAHPRSWRLLEGRVALPAADGLHRIFTDTVDENPGAAVIPALRADTGQPTDQRADRWRQPVGDGPAEPGRSRDGSATVRR